MVQIEREKTQQATSERAFDGGTTSTLTTTATRTNRESIEFVAPEQRHRQSRDQACATTTAVWTTSGCDAPAASNSARDSSSPPLTLIDANVASQASGSLDDKSHCHQLQTTLPPPRTTTVTTKTLVSIGREADKFSSLDREKFFGKHQDEVNNNSIQSHCRNQQHQLQEQQRQQQHQQQTDQKHRVQTRNHTVVAAESQPSIKQTQSQPISPLNLLTGLRMHTNNLRNQQQQQQQQRHQQLDAKILNNANSSPVSFVESSLNPCDDEQDSRTDRRLSNTRAQHQVSKPLQGINFIPSYTSIFDKPRTSQPATIATITNATSTPSARLETDNQQHSTSVYQKSITTTATIATSTTTTNPVVGRDSTNADATTTTASRNPIRKQSTQYDSLSSSRTLLTTISSIGNKSASQKYEKGDLKKLPAVFDYSSNRSRRQIDYDNQNHSQADFDLEAASSADSHSQTDADEDDDDDEDGECGELAEIDDEKLPFRSGLNKNPRSKERATNRSRSLVEAANDRKRVQESYRNNKFTGTATRLDSLMKPKVSASSKNVMSSSSSKRSLAGQEPQAHQTRISLDDMSRPPSFDTSTGKKHDQLKATSCRKLDLLEQVAYLDCQCHICQKNKKLTNLHDHLYYHQSLGALDGKLSRFNSSSAKSFDKNYPKTRICHMVLKSIILFLCTLLLILLIVSAIVISHYLPESMDKVVNASRSFNVTIAGRR